MPFIRFHFVNSDSLARINRHMTDRLQKAMQCPREHIVVENIKSEFIDNEDIKDTNNWPLVEVEYFERPRAIQDEVARILYEELNAAGYVHADIYFRYLQPAFYYTDGESMSR